MRERFRRENWIVENQRLGLTPLKTNMQLACEVGWIGAGLMISQPIEREQSLCVTAQPLMSHGQVCIS
jgi:hypothetical protein